MQREWQVGPHRARFEEPDVLIVQLTGPTDLEHAHGLVEVYREVGTRQPMFAVLHVKDSPVNAAARKYFTQQIRSEWYQAIIFVGAGVVERAMGKALTVALLFAGKWTAEFLYADTEAQARELIAKVRAKKAHKQG
ncbi:MAG TPA: hypothetical protein VF815_27630 [Myxococcaceae bacterium]|jgi:hypothetical protein